MDTNIELIYKRCKKSNKRPLLDESNDKKLKKIIKDLLKIRNPIYSKAKFIVKTNEQPVRVCNKILIYIKNLI